MVWCSGSHFTLGSVTILTGLIVLFEQVNYRGMYPIAPLNLIVRPSAVGKSSTGLPGCG